MNFKLDLTDWLQDKTVCPLCGAATVDQTGPQTKYECGSIIEEYDNELYMNTLTKKCFFAFLKIAKTAL